MWQTLKSIINLNTDDNITELKIDNKIISEPRGISQSLNNFYLDSIQDIVNSIDTLAFLQLGGTCSTSNGDSRDGESMTFGSFYQVDLSELRGIVFEQVNKSSTDGIDFLFMKNMFHVIGYPLLNLVNSILRLGRMPGDLKCSIIRPIPKTRNPREPEHYRPINMLPAVEKLVELVVYKQLTDFCSEHKIINKNQSGFRKFHSCESVIQLLLHTWKHARDDGETVGVVFLDLKRAFETVCREKLILKLKKTWNWGNSLVFFRILSI